MQEALFLFHWGQRTWWKVHGDKSEDQYLHGLSCGLKQGFGKVFLDTFNQNNKTIKSVCQDYKTGNIALLFCPCGIPLKKKKHCQCLQILASNFDNLFLCIAPLITMTSTAVTLRYSVTVITQQSLAAAAVTCWALMEVTASLCGCSISNICILHLLYMWII